MKTLHFYVLRELLKTFGLALAALTVLFTMGGGLYNIVSYEGISASDVFRFIPDLIPVVVTMMMPIAALFAATMVYGRLAADNELTACRAAGINIHGTFLSALLLSIGVAAFTLVFANFVIPRFVQRMADFARTNVRDLVAEQLQHKGFVHRGKTGENHYTITAERVQTPTDEALRAAHFETGPGLHYLLIWHPTFLQLNENGDLVRFTAARVGVCQFDTRPTPIELSLFVDDARDFQVGKQAVYLGMQPLGPVALPLPAASGKLTYADLRDLLRWQAAPWQAAKLRDQLKRFRVDLARERFYADCAQHLQSGGELVLGDDEQHEYRITGDEVRLERKGLLFDRARVVEMRPGTTTPLVREADRVRLVARPTPSGQLMVALDLSRKDEQTHHVDGLLAPEELWAELEQITPQAVCDPTTPLSLSDALADQRAGLQKAAREMVCKVSSTIHFRLGFISSVLVTVVMGAALGVIFRGARVLAAIALAMVPLFSVLILMVLGQKLAEEEATSRLGPLVTWGGLLACLLADGVILRLAVRR